MKYKLITKENPQDKTAPKKVYASAINAGRFTIKDFAKEISGRSSLTRGDIENVLNNFLDELPTFLKIGMSIQLGELGTMRLSLSSEGSEEKKDFDPSSIKAKIIFTPSVELKDNISSINYELQE